jgi:RNA polymerase sigma-70 factor (ECF subfamily)
MQSPEHPASWSSSSTLDLLRTAREGDVAARDELFARYEERVLEVVRMRMGRELRRMTESRDLLQEALAAAFRDLPRFEPRGETSFLRWLSTIVEHRVVSSVQHFQSAKRDDAHGPSLDAAPEPVLGIDARRKEPLSPSQEVLRSERQDVVRACIEELPQRYRELIVLRDYLGEPWEAIARETGAASPKAASMMHSRAVAMLGRLLHRRGVA